MSKTRLSAINSATHASAVKDYETGGKAAATRRRLLDAAAHVLAEKGFAGMRLSDVGDVAGVQAPAIYYHFSNKEDLVGEVFVAGLVRCRLALENTLKAHEEDDPLERLAIAIDAHLRMTARQSDYARAWMHRITGDVPTQVQELCQTDERAYARVWSRLITDAKESGLLRADIDSKAAQQLVIGALNALSFACKPGRSSVDSLVLSAQQILLSGLAFEERDWSHIESSEDSLAPM
ncbi:MAG: TetR/AcrR family transcriptional regulator [Acidimicrobiales bacterium]